MRTLSVAGGLNPASSRIRCAFAASPEAVAEWAVCLGQTGVPTTGGGPATSSQPKNAFFQLSALHRPAWAARFNEFTVIPHSSVPPSKTPLSFSYFTKKRVESSRFLLSVKQVV